MAQVRPTTMAQPSVTDRLTLIAISALAYIAAISLHELLGHAAACLALGNRLTEVNAFYVNCDYPRMSDAGIRLFFVAGPVVSLIIGVVSLLVLRRLPPQAFATKYFVWLLGSIALMAATGYLLFSGITGLGDFGTSRYGVLYQVTPAGLWRIVITIAGIASYILIAYISARAMDRIIGGGGVERIRRARHLALTSYLTGGAVSVAIGLLNPLGLRIVVESAVASSLGASSGLLWMMQFLYWKTSSSAPVLTFGRSWRWIATGGIATLVYALVFGPSLRP